MSSKASILKILGERQKKWAKDRAITFDHKGYLGTADENLFEPMSEACKTDFQSANGNELKRKLRALHSSSALATNFFDFWRDCRNRQPLEKALGLGGTISSLSLEKTYKTGLGNPANLDVALGMDDGRTIAIECKFTEPFRSKKKTFDPKYFTGFKKWASIGLSHCQSLAEDIQNKKTDFKYLDAPQLLKHSLALKRNLKTSFELHYVWYRPEDLEHAEAHEKEVQEFTNRIAADIKFRSHTYQELFKKMAPHLDAFSGNYKAYLKDRYFN